MICELNGGGARGSSHFTYPSKPSLDLHLIVTLTASSNNAPPERKKPPQDARAFLNS